MIGITSIHPPTSLQFINIADICLVLILAHVVTIIQHTILFWCYKRPYSRTMHTELTMLRYLKDKTMKLRSKGQATFVETSKLERKLLAKEKSIQDIQEKHKGRMTLINKVVKRMNYIIYFILFVTYFKTPLIRIAGTDPDYSTDGGDHLFLKGMIFPHSMIGIGNKVANYGMGNGGLGSLLVYYSAETAVGRVLDCLEILFI